MLCIICNNEILSKRAKKYCSRVCQDKGYSLLFSDGNTGFRTCNICSKEYKTGNLSGSKWCSKKCANIATSQRFTGFKQTQEHKDKISEYKKKENILKIGDFYCDKCDRHFETNTSFKAHTSYCNAKEDPFELKSCNVCQKQFSSRGLKIHMSMEHGDESKKNKRLTNLRAACKDREYEKISKQEISFVESLKLILSEDKIQHSFRIEKGHIFDLLLKENNVILEFDGDYWHGNKAKHQLTERMKKQYNIDVFYTKKAIKNGYDIVRIWASDSESFLEEFKEVYNVGIESFKDFIDRNKCSYGNIRHYCKKES